MTCDRQSHRVGAIKHSDNVIEVEVYDTAGLDSENRELCYKCIAKAINNGHEVLFSSQQEEDDFFTVFNAADWSGELVA